MKKIVFLFCITFLLSDQTLFASPGDTVTVQTFSFGSPQDAWFVFPSDTVRFEKILMKYTLKCNPAQSPACGEWDYLTYTYLYDHTGLQDSTLVHQPTYTVNGASPDSIQYMFSPSYSYHPSFQYSTVHSDTSSLNTYTVGSGSISENHPYGASNPVSHSQYLWTSSEMTTAGMSAGAITGLSFYVQTPGSSLHQLTIKIKSTAAATLSASTISLSGFNTVYSQNTSFSTTGWTSLQLLNSFAWDGTSNLIIDISYDNNSTGSDNVIEASNSGFNSGLVNAGADRCASFHSYGYIDVPMNNKLTALDSFVTVSYWAYGTPAFQPQDGTCFEAVDSSNNRILNAHMPWSDGNVYWDAGYSGTSYDRINKAATTAETEGQWNYWVFTKNVATGSMKIYLNGNLWHSGTSKVKPMLRMKAFRIGQGNWSGSQTYEGKLDEFQVYDKELSLAEIQSYMYSPITPADPNYAHLALYYRFNDGNFMTAADAAPGAHAPAVYNGGDNPLKSSSDLVSNYTETTNRPNITFEQGVFTSTIDTILVIDSTMNAPMQIITYNDSISHPGVPTDTIVAWPSYYNNYTYSSSGIATDSSFVNPDSTMHLAYYDWYRKFPQVIRYELARYITPYGNGLSLGSGWTWTFDVSDYRTLLADSVHLSAGNWQELLDVKFLMIKGTPPRDVVSIRNLWNGGFNYGVASDPIENHLQPLSATIPANGFTSRWKSRITGHGMDTPENCAEFCAKTHTYKVNGTQQFSKLVWRDNCDLNPLYPQGGTWVYDRANWCPGAEVWTYDWELTPYAPAGSTVTLDHDVQAYVSGGPWDYYQIEDQLVTYGAPNFSLDAAVDDILSPSSDQMWGRYNPVCTSPVIRIRNTGSTDLTSLTITYGINGATPSVYHWTGHLKFMESEQVTLGTFNWATGATDFTVTVSSPNGGSDQYSNNNTKVSKFTYPPVMPASFVIEYKTNNNVAEDNWTLKDDAGNVLYSRTGSMLLANTLYKDTVTLATGCYSFEMTDSGEDGLSWWANTAQGAGYVRFRNISPATVLKSFGADFGGQIYQQFTIGLTSGITDYIFTSTNTLNVYPNPSNGHVYINVDLNKRTDGKIEIHDILGKTVYEHSFNSVTAESIETDLSDLNKGMYFVNLKTDEGTITQKLLIQ